MQILSQIIYAGFSALLQSGSANLPATTEDQSSAAQTDTTQQLPKQAKPVAITYQPPNRGAPAQRVGGGTRSISQLNVLVPDHAAMTTLAQPRLYWFINPGFQNNIRFRLNEIGIKPPLFEILLPPQPNGGIRHLDLATHNIHLQPGKLYEWGVMLEPRPHQRWPVLVSMGRLLMQESDANLDAVSAEQRPYLAAKQGYWYDALDGLSRSMSAGSINSEQRLQRAILLEQGGLLPVAMYEREMMKYNH